MGKHYVPQFYLKGFSETENSPYIWTYDKNSRRSFRTNIRNIAQETNFYSDDTEAFLANKIETPTKEVIEKIKNHLPISIDDKEILAKFMSVLVKRVPASLKRARQMYPELSEQVYDELEKEIEQLKVSNPDKQEIIEQRQEEIRQIRENDPNDPKDIWEMILRPEMTPAMSHALTNMTWVFWYHHKKSVFLTSDNPVFYFTWMGIGKRNSEVSFPITSKITLWATWRTDLKEKYHRVKERTIHEINRRTVSVASRHVFFSNNEQWIINLANKKKIQLHQLV